MSGRDTRGEPWTAWTVLLGDRMSVERFVEHWVDSTAALAPLEPIIESADELALDTESNSMFAYQERICLLQLGPVWHAGRAESPLVVLDPIALGGPGLGVLRRWFATGRRTLMHGGEYDVAVLKRELGVGPSLVFDTQAAASMLGFQRTGYVNLVEELLGVTLAKEHQQFDWGRRPVPGGPRRYAFDDVRYLPELTRILESMASDHDLVEEIGIACEAVTEALAHAPLSEAERFWRVAGKVKVSVEALPRLHSLFLWREHEAIARDIPPGRLVPNDVLASLALRPPRDANALANRGLPKKLAAERADLIIEAAQNGSAEVPQKPRMERPDPLVKKRETALKQWREAEATRRGVTIQAVLPTRALDALAHGVPPNEAPQLGAKRLERYGKELARILGR